LGGASAIDFIATFMVSSFLLSRPRRFRHTSPGADARECPAAGRDGGRCSGLVAGSRYHLHRHLAAEGHYLPAPRRRGAERPRRGDAVAPRERGGGGRTARIRRGGELQPRVQALEREPPGRLPGPRLGPRGAPAAPAVWSRRTPDRCSPG